MDSSHRSARRPPLRPGDHQQPRANEEGQVGRHDLEEVIYRTHLPDSGIPFKPTAYQVRHTHASWLIDAGENPKAVMHRLGQADLRTTARYVHVLDETGESAAKRFESLLPPL